MNGSGRAVSVLSESEQALFSVFSEDAVAAAAVLSAQREAAAEKAELNTIDRRKPLIAVWKQLVKQQQHMQRFGSPFYLPLLHPEYAMGAGGPPVLTAAYLKKQRLHRNVALNGIGITNSTDRKIVLSFLRVLLDQQRYGLCFANSPRSASSFQPTVVLDEAVHTQHGWLERSGAEIVGVRRFDAKAGGRGGSSVLSSSKKKHSSGRSENGGGKTRKDKK